MSASLGYPYTLANGVQLTGGRMSFFALFADRTVRSTGLAYDTIYARDGLVLTDPVQLNEGAGSQYGLDRPCSAYGAAAGTYGFVNDVFFAGEETSDGNNIDKDSQGQFTFTAGSRLGGQLTAIDVDARTLYVAPMAGRAGFEQAAPIGTQTDDKVALVIGDDRQAAPLVLFVGEKGALPNNALHASPQFLVDNGLAMGRLFVWVADNGDRDPETFNGTGSARTGRFIPIEYYDPSLAGTDSDGNGIEDYDAFGFASLYTQDLLGEAVGAFRFSRPEDVAPNPANDAQFVFASTGRGGLFPSDDWGTIYVGEIDQVALDQPLDQIQEIAADLTILYDGDDAANQDSGIRSPDNLEWAADGSIYVNEDRSTGAFGQTSGVEASVWQLDPATGNAARIMELDRQAIPRGQADATPFSIGQWESSGILDVTALFPTDPGETLLLTTVQAHGVVGGGLALQANIANDLVEGGQLLLLSNQ